LAIWSFGTKKMKYQNRSCVKSYIRTTRIAHQHDNMLVLCNFNSNCQSICPAWSEFKGGQAIAYPTNIISQFRGNWSQKLHSFGFSYLFIFGRDEDTVPGGSSFDASGLRWHQRRRLSRVILLVDFFSSSWSCVHRVTLVF
jgi:hypothetical protein